MALKIPGPRDEFMAGSREIAPVLIGTIPFGFVAGVAAVSALFNPCSAP